MRANSVGPVPAISRIAGTGGRRRPIVHVYDVYGGSCGRLFTLTATFTMSDTFAARAALRRLTDGTGKVTN
jgi:hypothetical protein